MACCARIRVSTHPNSSFCSSPGLLSFQLKADVSATATKGIDSIHRKYEGLDAHW